MKSPRQHYLDAERLLTEVETIGDYTIPICSTKIAKAHVHALLAQCDPVLASEITLQPKQEYL